MGLVRVEGEGSVRAVGDERMTTPDLLTEEIVRRRSVGAATVVRSDRQRGLLARRPGCPLRRTIPDLLTEEIVDRRGRATAAVVRADRQRELLARRPGWHLRRTIPDLLTEEIVDRRGRATFDG